MTHQRPIIYPQVAFLNTVRFCYYVAVKQNWINSKIPGGNSTQTGKRSQPYITPSIINNYTQRWNTGINSSVSRVRAWLFSTQFRLWYSIIFFWKEFWLLLTASKSVEIFCLVSPIFFFKCSSLRKSGRYDNRISFILCFDIGQQSVE